MTLLLLSACGGVAFSPEATVTRTVLQGASVNLTIHQETVKIHQTLDISEHQSFVLLTLRGTRPEMGPVTCIYSYEAIKNTLGWTAANGSGTCRQNQPGEDVEELEIYEGFFSGRKPHEPGYSQVYGSVNSVEIVKVRITWDDNQVTEIEPVESTYLAIHYGEPRLRKIEALNNKDDVVFTHMRR